MLSDDRDETLHNHLINDSSKVAQFPQGAFSLGQLFLQILLVDHLEVNGFVAFIWLFCILNVQLELLVGFKAVLFHLRIKGHYYIKGHLNSTISKTDATQKTDYMPMIPEIDKPLSQLKL